MFQIGSTGKRLSLLSTAVPTRNLPPPDDSFIKLEPIDFDDPLADTSNIKHIRAEAFSVNRRQTITTQANWPGDQEFRFNFVDLLTSDRDLNGWTGLVSFESLQSLEKRIPNGENVATTYGMSLRNLIVMILVRTKMNIPFEQMTVLFPMKTTLLAKCFSEFLPILEAATSSSIPPPSKSTANVKETELVIERPSITMVGKEGLIRKITTSKTAIRINPAGIITNIVPVSGKTTETPQPVVAKLVKSVPERPTASFSVDLTLVDDTQAGAERQPSAIKSAAPKSKFDFHIFKNDMLYRLILSQIYPSHQR